MTSLKDNYESETILVLTPDAKLKTELAQLLTQKAYSVEFCKSSVKFLQTITRHPILVGIFDVGQGRKEKLEFIPIITRVKPDFSLIVISEESAEKKRRQILLNRLHYYFQKPVDYENLLMAVHSAFEFQRRHILNRGW